MSQPPAKKPLLGSPANPSTDERPSVFAYDDYRKFLRETYIANKKRHKKFSFRYFAKQAGFSSPMTLKRVIDGQRNLAPASAVKFARALKLNHEETRFFSHLILFCQAKSVDERQRFARVLLGARLYREAKPLAQAQYDYWAHWYHVAIRELMTLADFQEDPAWIAKKLTPKITPEQAADALQRLLDLEFIERDVTGRLRPKDRHIATGDGMVYASIANFHKEMIQRGQESLERFTGKERYISALTLTLSHDGFMKAQELINQLKKSLAALSHGEQMANKVYHINFQLFPITV